MASARGSKSSSRKQAPQTSPGVRWFDEHEKYYGSDGLRDENGKIRKWAATKKFSIDVFDQSMAKDLPGWSTLVAGVFAITYPVMQLGVWAGKLVYAIVPNSLREEQADQSEHELKVEQLHDAPTSAILRESNDDLGRGAQGANASQFFYSAVNNSSAQLAKFKAHADSRGMTIREALVSTRYSNQGGASEELVNALVGSRNVDALGVPTLFTAHRIVGDPLLLKNVQSDALSVVELADTQAAQRFGAAAALVDNQLEHDGRSDMWMIQSLREKALDRLAPTHELKTAFYNAYQEVKGIDTVSALQPFAQAFEAAASRSQSQPLVRDWSVSQ